MKGTIKVKCSEITSNCGEFAAIKRKRQSIPINQFLNPLEYEGDGNQALPCWIEGTASPLSTRQSSSKIVRTLPGQSLDPYANGVPSSSPGLRGTRYPGSSPRKTTQPQRGCGPCDATPVNPDGTALRFGMLANHSQGRPHSIRPTLGWRAESLWDRNHGRLTI